MIPILSIACFSETCRRFNLTNDGKCTTCSQPVVHNQFHTAAVACFQTTHFEWKQAPWMYLWACDMTRTMFGMMDRLVEPPAPHAVLIVDANMLSCRKCFTDYIVSIEDECRDTAYWPVVLGIRKAHESNRSPESLRSDGSASEADYPQLLLGSPRGPDSGDPG